MQMDFFGDDRAFLAKQRTAWAKAIEGDGAICPCCDRFGKVYKHKITQALALSLRWMATYGVVDSERYIDVQSHGPRFMLRSKTYSLLQRWELIEPKLGSAGHWRVTSQGLDFMNERITVPSAVFVYNDTIWGFTEEETSFRECFGKDFDFDEVMSSQFRWENVRGKK